MEGWFPFTGAFPRAEKWVTRSAEREKLLARRSWRVSRSVLCFRKIYRRFRRWREMREVTLPRVESARENYCLRSPVRESLSPGEKSFSAESFLPSRTYTNRRDSPSATKPLRVSILSRHSSSAEKKIIKFYRSELCVLRSFSRKKKKNRRCSLIFTLEATTIAQYRTKFFLRTSGEPGVLFLSSA